MWAGVTGGPPWGNGMMPVLSSESGALARGTLRLKMGGPGRVARVPGEEGGSREVQLTYLPEPIPPSRAWTTLGGDGGQGVGLRSVLLYLG